jgi:enoyl-CoA hydratase/carnithine racemase
MPGDDVRLERPVPGVALVVLDRPQVANALSRGLFAELSEALDEIEGDAAVRAWVLSGSPRPDGRPWFRAGADVMPEALAMAEAIGQLPVRGVATTLKFLALQRDMATHEALRWAQRMPDLRLRLRPFRDAAQRFDQRVRRP